ncbi:hypothetical protein OG562_19015 [Streptomyces sp. NBC_01275]|uniref:hypothetical protein n=1 Tax=Streptomyces sp. NBC_01275 TaxID=2903807 RepID=UPI002257DA90|nr:hypothetical protein [Streptomyces sp. NBC_01275]MCX4763033.1 hypothetical protein [Streptomyces sp. NBC_01275]
MRIAAIVAAVTGAVALSALAVPAAQAAPAGPAVTFSKVKVNAGKNIVVGTTAKVTVSATYTVTKPASLSASSFASGPVFYRGSTIDLDGDSFGGDNPGTCTTVSSTVLNCTAKVEFRPASSDDTEDLTNAFAGTWKLGALAVGSNGGITTQTGFGTSKVQRLAKLTTDAAPEPVKKGKTITVAGKLTRANWDTNKYAGYAAQPVKLQFKKKGATAYTTVKTIKTNSTGALKTTVTASADGSFRYVFAGTTTTPAVTSAADFVDVQ